MGSWSIPIVAVARMTERLLEVERARHGGQGDVACSVADPASPLAM